MKSSPIRWVHRLTVSEVAYSVGFKSASHFCKAFAARYNMTPSDVRQR